MLGSHVMKVKASVFSRLPGPCCTYAQIYFTVFIYLINNSSSHPEVFCKKDVFKDFRKFHRKTLVSESLFNKVADLQAVPLFKKRLQQRYFTVNIAKFQEHLFWRTSANVCLWILKNYTALRILENIYLFNACHKMVRDTLKILQQMLCLTILGHYALKS